MEKKDISEKDAKRLKEAVVQLSKLVSNSICADCHQHRSLWASVNFGIFVCSRCAGMHRHLGVHVSQVRSINLDTWTPIQLFSVILNGNMWTNAWLLSKTRTPDFGRQFGDDSAMSRFIQEKYEYSKYGDNAGILLVSKTNFSNVTVERALDVFKLAMQLHRQKQDHCSIRPLLIKAAGYDYSVPTYNPANRKLLLIMDTPSSNVGGIQQTITQAHISGIPQPKINNAFGNSPQPKNFSSPTNSQHQSPIQKSPVKVEKLIDLDDFTEFASATNQTTTTTNNDFGGGSLSTFSTVTSVPKSNSSTSFANFPTKHSTNEADWPTTNLPTSGSMNFMDFGSNNQSKQSDSWPSMIPHASSTNATTTNSMTNDFGNLSFSPKHQKTENKELDLFSSIGNGKNQTHSNHNSPNNGSGAIIGGDFLNFAMDNQQQHKPAMKTISNDFLPSNMGNTSTNSIENNFFASPKPGNTSTSSDFGNLLGSPVMAPTPFGFDSIPASNNPQQTVASGGGGVSEANKGQDLDFILGLYNK